MEDLFTTKNAPVVASQRILYTPSNFARMSLAHLQEIGSLQAKQPHVSKRENLSSYLFFMVTEGEGRLQYGEETYPLFPGDCVFIDCRRFYSHSTQKKLWSLSWIHFYGPALSAIYDKYLERGGRPVFHPADLGVFTALHQRIFQMASSDDHIRDMKINGELNHLLTLLMAESWHPRPAGGEGLKKQNVLPVKQYLEEHYEERITLDFLSEHFFISKYYLTRVFKEQFGVSINHYLVNLRVTKAKQLLRFTDEKLEVIGYACGLGAPHYFSRIFKQVEGVSPSEYREKW